MIQVNSFEKIKKNSTLNEFIKYGNTITKKPEAYQNASGLIIKRVLKY
jgi:hypothetical protein